MVRAVAGGDGQNHPTAERQPRTALDYLRLAQAYLARHGSASPRLDAEVLLAHVLGITRLELYTRFEQPLVKGEVDAYREALMRRARREPVAYITGTKEFYGLELAVAPGVLIPRPETEFLVELTLKALAGPVGQGSTPEQAEPELVVDVGTGCGAIALAVVVRRPAARALGIDRSGKALAQAQRNAARLGVAGRVRWIQADGLHAVGDGAARVVVSNPPYIPTQEIPRLAPEISRYEPREALDGGPDGLDVARQVALQAARVLAPGGALFMELGNREQAEQLASWVRRQWAANLLARAEVRVDDVSGAVAFAAWRAAGGPSS